MKIFNQTRVYGGQYDVCTAHVACWTGVSVKLSSSNILRHMPKYPSAHCNSSKASFTDATVLAPRLQPPQSTWLVVASGVDSGLVVP
jgi:hypothetical protein